MTPKSICAILFFWKTQWISEPTHPKENSSNCTWTWFPSSVSYFTTDLNLPFIVSCFALSLLFQPFLHVFSYQDHRVRKWQIQNLNWGWSTLNVLLIPSSHTPGNQETRTKLPLQLCERIQQDETQWSPWERDKRPLPVFILHYTWL